MCLCGKNVIILELLLWDCNGVKCGSKNTEYGIQIVMGQLPVEKCVVSRQFY